MSAIVRATVAATPPRAIPTAQCVACHAPVRALWGRHLLDSATLAIAERPCSARSAPTVLPTTRPQADCFPAQLVCGAAGARCTHGALGNTFVWLHFAGRGVGVYLLCIDDGSV